ncbi:MAG TPA: DinB family protein [Thermoanaerobaculia bacterium]|nr:DinB family protein [Thermoanaerobaculia bacterium]
MKKTLVLLCLLAAPLALARTQNPSASAPKAPGFRGEFYANLDEVEQKIVQLAEATPADKFAWHPAGDVRSVSEVYMHIAGWNYFLATFLGVQPPKMNGDLEKTVTAKSQVLAELKRSFAHLRTAAGSVKNLETPVKMMGKQTTQRDVLVTMLSHLHEHLGQSIAYARMNGVIPPWSR